MATDLGTASTLASQSLLSWMSCQGRGGRAGGGCPRSHVSILVVLDELSGLTATPERADGLGLRSQSLLSWMSCQGARAARRAAPPRRRAVSILVVLDELSGRPSAALAWVNVLGELSQSLLSWMSCQGEIPSLTEPSVRVGVSILVVLDELSGRRW